MSERKPRSPEIKYYGTDLEKDLFGEMKFTVEYKRKYKELVEKHKNRANISGFVPYKESIDLIREHYAQDPTNPEKDFSNDLRLEIGEKLGLEGDDLDRLKFYTAVGGDKSPLDFFHGTDAFIDLESVDNDPRKLITIKLDASLRKLGDKKLKADLQIEDMPDPNEEEDAYFEKIEGYAKDISDIIKNKVEENKPRKQVGTFHNFPV